jgi:ornithine carbamoyltransferase
MNNFINIKDIPANDLRFIIESSKKRKKNNKKENFFINKLMIILMEKPSLRTRMSLLNAAYAGGGKTITLRSDEIHLGLKGESIKDTAEILSRSGDLFVFRTADDKKII